MAPQISISPATFARLQKHAEPLVDDIESLINKLIDEREKKQGTASPPPGGGAKEYGKGTSPNLTHTKVLSAELGGKTLPKSEATWNGLLTEAIVQAAAKLKNVDALKEMMIINFVAGKRKNTATATSPQPACPYRGKMPTERGRRFLTSSR